MKSEYDAARAEIAKYRQKKEGAVRDHEEESRNARDEARKQEATRKSVLPKLKSDIHLIFQEANTELCDGSGKILPWEKYSRTIMSGDVSGFETYRTVEGLKTGLEITGIREAFAVFLEDDEFITDHWHSYGENSPSVKTGLSIWLYDQDRESFLEQFNKVAIENVVKLLTSQPF